MSTSITLVRNPQLHDAPYAYAAIAPAGAQLIFLAGACPQDADGTTVAIGDYPRQAAACLEALKSTLGACGASITDVVSTRVLVATARQDELIAAWNVVREAFGDHDVPSTLVGVSVLGYPDQLVEVEAVAVMPQSPRGSVGGRVTATATPQAERRLTLVDRRKRR